jgi:hypothetical protein
MDGFLAAFQIKQRTPGRTADPELTETGITLFMTITPI